jgi:hypothetical protein
MTLWGVVRPVEFPDCKTDPLNVHGEAAISGATGRLSRIRWVTFSDYDPTHVDHSQLPRPVYRRSLELFSCHNLTDSL